MRQTRVRLSASYTGTSRHSKKRGPHEPKGWPKDDWVTILLPPEEPDGNWLCGTANVWRLGPDTLQEVGVPTDQAYYVCEHRIEID